MRTLLSCPTSPGLAAIAAKREPSSLWELRSSEIQKPQSLYCFPARRNREPTSTKSTSKH
jgi:hypothetical protein